MTEFSRPIKLDTLGGSVRSLHIEANADERAALARRFDLIAIDRLEADAELTREGEVIRAQGRLVAAVVQACVASGAPVPAQIAEPFTLRFVPEAAFDPDAEEVELSEEDCDTIPYQNAAIDLGEAIAETMALALEPFPRSPDAEAILKAAGVVGEDEAEVGPFAALKALKDRLGS